MAKVIDWDSRIGRRLRLRDLHVFFAVVQSGSMAKAAAHLRVTQPAVSKAISELEAALRVRLFDRSPQGVEPTVYGSALLKCGAAAFDELRQGIRSIEFLADPETGDLKIGCSESTASSALSQVIQRFLERYPRIALSIVDADFASFAPKVRDRSLDLALVRLGSRAGAEDTLFGDMNVEVLFDDELVVAAGMRSRWARRRKIDLADLVNEPWILSGPASWNNRVVAEAFRARGLDMPKISVRTISVAFRTNLAAAGSFITTLPRSVLRLNARRYGLTELPIALPVRPWPVAIVTLRNRTLSPVVELFIEHIRELTRPMRESGPAQRKIVSE